MQPVQAKKKDGVPQSQKALVGAIIYYLSRLLEVFCLQLFIHNLLKMLSGVDVEHMTNKDGESYREDDMRARIHDESESLSDIDDAEVLSNFILYLSGVMVLSNLTGLGFLLL